VVVEPKRGRRLAFKGFLVAFILALIYMAATKNDKIGSSDTSYPSGSSAQNSGTASSSGGNPAPSGVSTSAVDPKEVLLRDVKLTFKWYKEGFGNVMVADFTIKNPTQYRFKDFTIKCIHSGPSGTEIDSNTRTIYEVVQPKSTKVIKEMNMGFIHSQAARSGCGITDLTAVQ
jgi:hypothetical protein